jgi:hypothetical protein
MRRAPDLPPLPFRRPSQSDLARGNGFTPKLADFGLAKVMSPNGQSLINRSGAGEP